MQINITTFEGKTTEDQLSLSDDVFAVPFSNGLVHQVITSYMAAARSGVKANKGRSEVRGGGAKPWRQKGTGRARAGTNSSPIWRSGGVTFAAKPRSFEKKVNRKMYRSAIRCILSEQMRKGAITVVDTLALETHKTKVVSEMINKNGFTDALFIEETISDNLYFATRNIPKVWAIDFVSINPYDLYSAKRLVVTADVMKKLEEWLA